MILNQVDNEGNQGDAPVNLSRLMVLTPLHDPHGQALHLFLSCVESVLSQRNQELEWVISVQQVPFEYQSVLRNLQEKEWITVRYTAEARSLSSNLNTLLDYSRGKKCHILCQDDRYASAQSAQVVSEWLDSWDVVYLKPRLVSANAFTKRSVHWELQVDTKIEPQNRAMKSREACGLNYFGGLSSIAWNSARLHCETSVEYELLADLQLRSSLGLLSSRVGVTQGQELIEECQWHGQSQVKLRSLFVEEADMWVARNGLGGGERLRFALKSALGGSHVLALAWTRSANLPVPISYPTILGIWIVGFCARTNKFSARHVRRVFRRLISWR